MNKLAIIILVVFYVFCNVSDLPATTLYLTPLSQHNPQWSSKTIGSCNLLTIGSDGCAITSLSMIFNYYRPGFTDPSALNTYATKLGGYERCSSTVPECCVKFDSIVPICGPQGVDYIDTVWPPDVYEAIDQEVDSGYPVIAYVWYGCSGCVHYIEPVPNLPISVACTMDRSNPVDTQAAKLHQN